MTQFKYLSIFTLLLIVKICNAQVNSFDDWMEGEVYLNNNDTLKGYVIYEEQQNIVQFSKEDRVKVKTFSAFVLKGFTLINGKNTRNFHRFYWNKGYDNVQEIPDFFEVLYVGKFKVLSKDKKIVVMEDWAGSSLGVNTPYSSTTSPIYSEKIVRNLYIQLDDKRIYGIYRPKKDFINMFPNKQDELKEFYKGKYISSDNSKLIIEIVKMMEN